MHIVAASDIHGQWSVVNYPKGDVLLLAGDILSDHSFHPHSDANVGLQKEELLEFDNFCGYYLKEVLGYKHILFVAGNHDFVFQKCPEITRELEHITYIQDRSVTIDGIKFYGSPWQPWCWDWAFNFPCHLEKHGGSWFRMKHYAEEAWGKIPEDVDVLITHTPPLYLLDTNKKGFNEGCQFLAERLHKLPKLKLHVFGHIHESRGIKIVNNTTHLNVAQCQQHGTLASEPVSFMIDSQDAEHLEN